MKIHPFSPRMRIHTIDLEFQGMSEAVAAYLIEAPRGWILVETGPESTRERLLSGIAAAGCDLRQIDAIFVTHIHLDHAGAAGWFANEGIPVYVHRRGAKHLVDPARLEESARQIYADRFDSLWGSLTPAPEDSIHSLEESDLVDVAGIQVEAIETPGHAFHHHAFAINDLAFVGDSAGAKVDGAGYLSVTSAPPQFHLGHTLASLEKLKSRSFRSLYLTHFGAVDAVTEHLDDYRRAVELNALFVRQRVEEGMDPESIRIAYEAFNLEQAFRFSTPGWKWEILQMINGTDMCADGIRMFWEKEIAEGTSNSLGEGT